MARTSGYPRVGTDEKKQRGDNYFSVLLLYLIDHQLIKLKKMKKKFLTGLFALALLVTAGFGVSKSMENNVKLSYLALANVEALVNGKSSPIAMLEVWAHLLFLAYLVCLC